jgi:hypothetical protein
VKTKSEEINSKAKKFIRVLCAANPVKIATPIQPFQAYLKLFWARLDTSYQLVF